MFTVYKFLEFKECDLCLICYILKVLDQSFLSFPKTGAADVLTSTQHTASAELSACALQALFFSVLSSLLLLFPNFTLCLF